MIDTSLQTPPCLPVAALRRRIVGVGRRVPVGGDMLSTYANLDNATTTPPLQEVLDHVAEAMVDDASVHRGSGFKSRRTTAAHDAARVAVARFFGAFDRQLNGADRIQLSNRAAIS